MQCRPTAEQLEVVIELVVSRDCCSGSEDWVGQYSERLALLALGCATGFLGYSTGLRSMLSRPRSWLVDYPEEQYALTLLVQQCLRLLAFLSWLALAGRRTFYRTP